MAIIGATPGLMSKDIIVAAQKKRKLGSRDVFANLYRLQHKRHLIRSEGPKGATRYFLAESQEGAD